MKSIHAGVIILLLAPLCTSAQRVSGILLKDIQSVYIQVTPLYKTGNKIVLDIDFGQPNEMFNMKDTQLKDEDDVPIVFNSSMDGLNFLHQFGYELADTFISTSDSPSYPHFILKKEAATAAVR